MSSFHQPLFVPFLAIPPTSPRRQLHMPLGALSLDTFYNISLCLFLSHPHFLSYLSCLPPTTLLCFYRPLKSALQPPHPSRLSLVSSKKVFLKPRARSRLRGLKCSGPCIVFLSIREERIVVHFFFLGILGSVRMSAPVAVILRETKGKEEVS